jgi:serine/threonine protein kinase
VLDPEGALVTRSYRLIEEIGRGAAGTVWRAQATKTGREYAVKILHDDLAGAPKAAARFLQERAILLRLRHDNLVAVHDLLFTEDGRFALVLDLVTGGSLRELLRQRTTLPPAEAAGFLAQVAAGLAAVHAAGIVHRDLKPDNILLSMWLDGSPRVRLTDFGIARVLDGPRLTTTGAVLGTPNYMAPEVIEGDPATPAADVYALGIMLYELLVGRPPFDDPCDTAILLRHARASARPITGMPARAWMLIKRCLDRDPRKRPTAAEAEASLRIIATETEGADALAPLPTEDREPATYVVADGPSPTPGRFVPRPRRRSRTVTSALVAIGVLIVTIGGFDAAEMIGTGAGTGRDAAKQGPALVTGPTVADPGPSGTGSPTQPPASASASPGLSPPSAGPVPIARTSTGPGGMVPAGATPEAYGPWQCTPTYRWSLAHPVLGKACYAIGPSVRAIGTLMAPPGVSTDATISVQDADTHAVVAGPFDCPGLQFNDMVSENSCGPFAMQLERGRSYRIIAAWKYTGIGILPAGSVAGEPFTW